MPAPKGSATLPKTKVYWQMIALSDRDPNSKQWTTFVFPRKMIAWPLTTEGPAGSGPNNKAAWWPYFQQRHKIQNNYWVQGHMLNDNIHGPGEPKNLVPITGTLNTNMLGIVERFVKDAVSKGAVLYYEVEAHWEGATPLELSDSSKKASFPRLMSELAQQGKAAIQSEDAAIRSSDAIKFPNRKVPKVTFENPFAGATFTPTTEMIHPAKVRQTCGLIADGGSLLWGEQFAPTRLSWRVRQSTNWLAAPDWLSSSHAMIDLSASWQMRSEDWYNNFP
jgi:hypothetical protein